LKHKGIELTNEEAELDILRSVGKVTNQKSIAAEIGYSVGKVNYVLNGLIKKGLIKAERFINSKQKQKYKYLLTEQGLKEKVALTEKFIEKKKKEYDQLQADLKRYKADSDYAKSQGNI